MHPTGDASVQQLSQITTLTDEANLVTNEVIKAGPGGDPPLDCAFTGRHRPRWFVIQWKKITNGNHTHTLLSLPPPTVPRKNWPEPEWGDGVDPSFKSRVQKTIQSDREELIFNMKISDFQCSDIGLYVCEIVTSRGTHRGWTQLVMEAPPSKPEINYNSLEVNMNHTFTLQCAGKVGMPPRMIRWYRKLPEETAFRRVESGYQPEVQQDEDCIQYTVIRIDVSVNEKSSGSIYRCAVDDNSIDQVYSHLYDNITVRLIVSETPPPIPPPYSNVDCEDGKDCASGESRDGRSIAARVLPHVLPITMLALSPPPDSRISRLSVGMVHCSTAYGNYQESDGQYCRRSKK
ncbi:hypothetical protein ScPMuIL_002738 [Solemya velum]